MYVFACFYAIRCVPYLVIILKQGFVVWGVGGFLSLFFNLFWTTDLFENLKIAVASSLSPKMHVHTRLHTIQGSWIPCRFLKAKLRTSVQQPLEPSTN